MFGWIKKFLSGNNPMVPLDVQPDIESPEMRERRTWWCGACEFEVPNREVMYPSRNSPGEHYHSKCGGPCEIQCWLEEK